MTKIKNFVIDKLASQYEAFEQIACTDEENEAFYKLKADGGDLPEDVREYSYVEGFYRLEGMDINKREIELYIALKKLQELEEQTSHIKTIKNCVLFFTAITVGSLVIGVLWNLI